MGVRFERIGLEAGPLSQWLFEGLAKAGLPVICIETRHAKAILKAQVNKTDRNDARGIAQMIRPCIPGRKSRGKRIKHDKRRYRIEIMFGRLKIGAGLPPAMTGVRRSSFPQ
ncbi:hypothetical protein IT40_26150 [Paracoccus versutus]|nr:hypothetical protein IT40_26150 [Paracoccus versutus]